MKNFSFKNLMECKQAASKIYYMKIENKSRLVFFLNEHHNYTNLWKKFKKCIHKKTCHMLLILGST